MKDWQKLEGFTVACNKATEWGDGDWCDTAELGLGREGEEQLGCGRKGE